MEELKQKKLYLAAAGEGDGVDNAKQQNNCDKSSPTSVKSEEQHDEDEEDKSDKVISANGNTLINRDNVLLPTPNDTNYNKDKLKENIKDVSNFLQIKTKEKLGKKFILRYILKCACCVCGCLSECLITAVWGDVCTYTQHYGKVQEII